MSIANLEEILIDTKSWQIGKNMIKKMSQNIDYFLQVLVTRVTREGDSL